jgi:hypothetical protein
MMGVQNFTAWLDDSIKWRVALTHRNMVYLRLVSLGVVAVEGLLGNVECDTDCRFICFVQAVGCEFPVNKVHGGDHFCEMRSCA